MTAEVSYAWAGSPAGWNMIGRLPPGVWGNVRRWRTTASLAPSSWASEATNSVGAGAIYSSLRAGRSDCRRSKWDANEGWRRSPPSSCLIPIQTVAIVIVWGRERCLGGVDRGGVQATSRIMVYLRTRTGRLE